MTTPLRMVVAGSTGFLGKPLCRALARAGHEVTALARNTRRAAANLPAAVKIVEFDTRTAGPWRDAVAEADVVINLCGEPIAGKRWNAAYKSVLRSSRIDPTRALVNAMASREQPGRSLLNASGISYYGDRGDEIVTEETPPGDDFLARLAVDWEAEALRAEEHGIRVVLLRTGIVLGEGGGALEEMVKVFRRCLGGPMGSGRQWFPWIHLEDYIEMVHWAALNPNVRGPMNVVAPYPVRNSEFAQVLARTLRRPIFGPVPAPLLRLVVGEMADTLLGGQRAAPEVARMHGFVWKHPSLGPALASLLGAKART